MALPLRAAESEEDVSADTRVAGSTRLSLHYDGDFNQAWRLNHGKLQTQNFLVLGSGHYGYLFRFGCNKYTGTDG